MWASPTFMRFLVESEYGTHDYTTADFAWVFVFSYSDFPKGIFMSCKRMRNISENIYAAYVFYRSG